MPLSGPRARQSKSAYQNQQLSSATVDWSFIVCTTGLVPVQMVLCMTQNGLWNNKNPYAVRTMSLWEAASQRKDFCLAQLLDGHCGNYSFEVAIHLSSHDYIACSCELCNDT